MAASQLDLILSQVQQLPANEQLQIIKRVADSLGHIEQPERNVGQVAGMPQVVRQIDESHFRQLADQWRRETAHVSSLKQACLHIAYQRIIGMGPAVVPYLLRELQQAPDHWFWALNAITEEDPAQAEDTLAGATQAWLAWGREKGYL
jgi:hypothetical protein